MCKLETIADLTPDPRNANRGTERGRGLLEKSMRNLGAGRSVLADKHGTIIAGNKTLEVAADLGLEVQTVQTDGTRLVVVQRTDLDLETDKAAAELAVADNRVGEVDLDWNAEALAGLADAGVDLGEWFFDDELADVLGVDKDGVGGGDNQGGGQEPETVTCPACGHMWMGRQVLKEIEDLYRKEVAETREQLAEVRADMGLEPRLTEGGQ